MKRAKVSAVYEGKGRKRNRTEEEGEEDVNSSRKARKRAKARKYGSRANARTHCGLSTGRTIMTRSMATLSKTEEEKGNQEMEKAVVVKEEEKRSEIDVVEEKLVGGVVEMLEEMLKELDWPPVLSYEEEYWLGSGRRWAPNCEMMTGDVWLGGEGVEPNDWVVDIWGT